MIDTNTLTVGCIAIVSLLTALWVLRSFERRDRDRADKATREAAEDEAFTRRMQLMERRLDIVEQALQNAPTHRDLSDIHKVLGDINARLAGVGERLTVTQAMTQTIQTHLMENDR